jgi:hypothetical protein
MGCASSSFKCPRWLQTGGKIQESFEYELRTPSQYPFKLIVVFFGRFFTKLQVYFQLSLCLEKHIIALEAANVTSPLDDEDCLEDKALELAIDEVYEGTGSKWKPWAKNARSMRIGDIILIVDSDTVVPEVKFLFLAILKMLRSILFIPFLFCYLGLL